MNRGLTTTAKYQKPFGFVRPAALNRLYGLKHRSSLPLVPPPVLPPPPPVKSIIPQKTRQDPHQVSFDDAKVISYSLGNKSHRFGYFPWMVIENSENDFVQPDWDRIKKLNDLSTKPKPPKNAVLISEWINGEQYQYPWTYILSACGKKRPVNHQFMFVFKELLLKTRVDAVERISLMLKGILELALDKQYVRELLAAVETHIVCIDLERYNLYDTICDYTYMLENEDNDAVEERTLFIIKTGLMNYWLHSGDRDCMERWDFMIHGMLQKLIQIKVEEISNGAEDLRKEMREARVKVDHYTEGEDPIDNWNYYMDKKKLLMEWKKKKEYMLSL